jgi:hypothetical protein
VRQVHAEAERMDCSGGTTVHSRVLGQDGVAAARAAQSRPGSDATSSALPCRHSSRSKATTKRSEPGDAALEYGELMAKRKVAESGHQMIMPDIGFVSISMGEYGRSSG